jgi:hypothetical protein
VFIVLFIVLTAYSLKFRVSRVFSLPARSETHDVTVRLAGVNPDQLAIEKELQSPIFARSVSVAVTDLGSLHLLFHRGYSLQERRRMRQQLLSRFFRFLDRVHTAESKDRANPPNFQKFFDLLVSRCGGGRFSSISNSFNPISLYSSIYMTYDI